LARDRPAASQLTRFYLCVASGGVIGGALVGPGAPLRLPGCFEVEIGLALTAIAIAWRAWPAHWRWRVLALLLPPLALGATLWRIKEVSANAIALSAASTAWSRSASAARAHADARQHHARPAGARRRSAAHAHHLLHRHLGRRAPSDRAGRPADRGGRRRPGRRHGSGLRPGAERAWSDDYSNIVRSLRAPGVLVRQE
jgi:hypothetical protein